MKSAQLSFFLLVIFVQSISGQDYDTWIDTVDELGEPARFTCYNYPSHPRSSDDGEEPIVFPNSTIWGWMLPNLTIIEDLTYTDGNIAIIDGGVNFTIASVAKEDIGLYHCMLWDQDGDLYMVKWGVNMKGPYFEDLWDKYRTNTIVACAAGGGFTLLMLIICGVYQCRYIPDDQRGPDSNGDLPGGKELNGKVNPAYMNDTMDAMYPTTSSGNTQTTDTPISTIASIQNEISEKEKLPEDESKF